MILTLVNREDGFEDAEIGRVPLLAPASVADGGWVKWIESSTRVDAWLVDVSGIALADPPPVATFDLLPRRLEAGVGHHDLAADGMGERPSRSTRALLHPHRDIGSTHRKGQREQSLI